jgi:hypothetical protein
MRLVKSSNISLMGFAMKHFSDASGVKPSNIAICFSMGFPWLFSWIKLRKLTIWIHLLLSIKRKTPFGSMCCLLSRVGPLLGWAIAGNDEKLRIKVVPSRR